jgi:biopolymer transport protein TolR
MGMGAGGSRAVPYINVTPLIDVLLVLLIIFMVVTPLKPKRFKTLVPEPPDNNAQPNPIANKLLLRVDIQDNKLMLYHDAGGQMIAEPVGTIDPKPEKSDTRNLGAKLSDILRGRSEVDPKTVFIKAPKSVPYGEVVQVIDAIKGAGADPVGLQIDDLATK